MVTHNFHNLVVDEGGGVVESRAIDAGEDKVDDNCKQNCDDIVVGHDRRFALEDILDFQ